MPALEFSPQLVERASNRLAEFVSNYGGVDLFSTSSDRVFVSEDLYNVKGSTPDPEIDGLSWKQLLLFNGIGGSCYAETPIAPDRSSHPSFRVGGHMTDNPDGSVAVGGTCFLMPLCSWHNSTARDEMPFEHSETEMLKLFGYMQGEPAATYLARRPEAAPMSLVYLSVEGLAYRALATEEEGVAPTALVERTPWPALRHLGVVLRRIDTEDGVRFRIEDACLDP